MRYVGEIPLSLGQYGLRDGLVVYGKFLPNGVDFTLVVVHLKAYSAPRSTSIREEELSLLGQWVQTQGSGWTERNYFKSFLFFSSEPIDMEVGIEGEGLLDAQAFHHREIDSIHQREVLVPVLCNNFPGVFQVFSLRHHELHRPGKEEIPELQGCISTKVMGDKEPTLKENIICSDKLLFPDELFVDLTGRGVVPVGCIG